MKANNRRRHYWINPGFQRRYLRIILSLQLLTAAATALLTLGIAFGLMNPAFEAGPRWNQIFVLFLLMLGIVAVVLIYAGIRVSHRICGPVYRFRQTLKTLRHGKDPGEIKLRDHDELVELADELNQTFNYLRNHPWPDRDGGTDGPRAGGS